MNRACGCTADTLVFGHTCGPVRMSADAQARHQPAPRMAEVMAALWAAAGRGHAGMPGNGPQAVSGDPGAAHAASTASGPGPITVGAMSATGTSGDPAY